MGGRGGKTFSRPLSLLFDERVLRPSAGPRASIGKGVGTFALLHTGIPLPSIAQALSVASAAPHIAASAVVGMREHATLVGAAVRKSNL